MSNHVYPTVREKLLSWAIHSTGPADVHVKVCGVDNTYVYDATHNDVTDLGSTGVIDGTELSGMTFIGGLLKAADTPCVGIATGPTLGGLVVYFDWGSGTQLICFIDTSSDASLPSTLTSTTLTVGWNVAGICQI